MIHYMNYIFSMCEKKKKKSSVEAQLILLQNKKHKQKKKNFLYILQSENYHSNYVSS